MPQHPPTTANMGRLLRRAGCQIGGVALVQFSRFIELGVAPRRRVGAQARQSLPPRPAVFEYVGEMRWARAVHHEVSGGTIGRRIDLFDRFAQPLTTRKSPVGLGRERDRRGNACGHGCPNNADRLLRVGHRDRGDLVGSRGRERPDLDRVIALGILRRHRGTRVLAVTARTDTAAYHCGDASAVAAARTSSASCTADRFTASKR